jgi:hypothetical protein
LITAEIAGYTHDTETKCVECVRTWATRELQREQYWPEGGFSAWSTEGLLNALAALWAVDRDWADSNDFPLPFSGQTAITDKQLAVCDGDPTPRCACGTDFLGEF